MTTAVVPKETTWTVADLADRFGDMPLWRIRFSPMPGTATEQDILNIEAKEGRLCELVDGVLVEKPMALRESALAITLASLLKPFVLQKKIGTITGEAGMMRLTGGSVRIPDVAFIPWDRFPERRLPDKPIPDLAPELAVEVLSPSNTDKEMKAKRREYFDSGVRLVWFVDPDKRTVEVFTAPEQSVLLTERQTLDGGGVLPGFTLPLAQLFAELDEQGPPAP